jgi:hypothetical protein
MTATTYKIWKMKMEEVKINWEITNSKEEKFIKYQIYIKIIENNLN